MNYKENSLALKFQLIVIYDQIVIKMLQNEQVYNTATYVHLLLIQKFQ